MSTTFPSPAQPVAVDVTTGLPEIPTGYRWKVKIYDMPYSFIPSLRVSLYKKRMLVESMDIFLGFSDPRDTAEGRTGFERHHELIRTEPEDYPESIYNLALRVLEKQEKQMKKDVRNARHNRMVKKLNGWYPPKKLEN